MRLRAGRFVGVLATAALMSACGDDDSNAGDNPGASLSVAIARVDAGLALDLDRQSLSALLEQMCAVAGGADDRRFIDLVRGIPATNSPDLAGALGALAEGAALRCPDVAEALDGLVESTYEAAGPEFDQGPGDTSFTTRDVEPAHGS